MTQEKCIHGMLITVPISCSLCRQQRGRGSRGALVAPPEEVEEEATIDWYRDQEEGPDDGERGFFDPSEVVYGTRLTPRVVALSDAAGGTAVASRGGTDDNQNRTPVVRMPLLPIEQIADPTLPPLLTPAERQEKERLGNLPIDEVLKIPAHRVRLFEGQPRRYFNQRRLEKLGLSIERRGQKTPCSVRWLPNDDHYFCQLIDGERRLRAINLRGLPILRAVRDQVANESEQFRTAAISNFGREGHTPLEIAEALERIKQETGATLKDLADDFGKSVSWVQQHLSLTKLSPRVREMMSMDLPDDKRIKFVLAMVLAPLPHALQEKLATEVINGNVRATLANQYVRRRAQEEGSRTSLERSPRQDWAVVSRTLGVLEQRFELLEDMSPNQIAALFANRDPRDYEETARRLAELGPRFAALAEKFSRARTTSSPRG